MRPVFPLLAFAATAALLSGCGTSRDRGTVAQRAACNQRADEVYTKQNRDQVYRDDMYATSTRDAPFAGAGLVGNTSRGLSGEYARDRLVDDCINGATAAATPAPSSSGGSLLSSAPPTSSSPLARPPR